MLSVAIILGAVLSAAALGQSALTASLLATRKDPRGIYRPLFVFFVANTVAELSGVSDAFVASEGSLTLHHVIDLTAILAFTLIAPSIWIYVRALTAEEKISYTKGDFWHLTAFFIGVIVCLLLISSPIAVREQIIGDGDGPETQQVIVIMLALILLMLTWIVQAVIYVSKIFLRLMRYRTRLKDIFASTEGRELHWISWVVGLLAINVVLIIGDMFFELPAELDLLSSILDLGLIWILSLWGLRATPSIENFGAPLPAQVRQAAVSETVKPAPAKYEKSALTDEHIERIAEKLDRVMREQKLYLEPTLSLRDLAKAISTPPNYVSQTLNSRIGETFFDYVNSWRIKEALPMITGSDESILNIVYDVGFNSRSSFYKAFKRETGMTPTAYRAKHSSEKSTPQTE